MRQAGLEMSGEDLKAAKEYRLGMLAAKEAVEGLEISIGRKLIPTMTEMIVFAQAAAKQPGALFKIIGGAAGGDTSQIVAGMTEVSTAAAKMLADIHKRVEEMSSSTGGHHTEPPKVKALRESFTGISNLLDQVNERMAKFGSDDDQVAAMVNHLAHELTNQADALKKLHDEHKIDADVYQRQIGLIDRVREAIGKLGDTETAALAKKHADAIAVANRELADKLDTYAEQTTAHKIALLDKELDATVARLVKEKTLTMTAIAEIVAIRKAALEQIDREESQKENERKTRFAAELATLEKTADAMLVKVQTGEAKIRAEYDATLAKYRRDEENKALLTAKTQAEVLAIDQRFEAIRAAALKKKDADLQAFTNSQGFSAAFGSVFGSTISHNQALMQQWAEGGVGAIDMMAVAMQSFHDTGLKTMLDFGSATGNALAQAIEGEKPFGEAMEAMAKSTVDSIANQALVQAGYSLALGFLRLAQWEPGSASEAFTAAAEFAAVGGAAAGISRLIPSSGSAGGGGSASPAASSSGSTAASGATAGSSGGQSGPQPTQVTLVVQGHVIGPDSAATLAAIINEGVSRGVVVNSTYAMKDANRQR